MNQTNTLLNIKGDVYIRILAYKREQERLRGVLPLRSTCEPFLALRRLSDRTKSCTNIPGNPKIQTAAPFPHSPYSLYIVIGLQLIAQQSLASSRQFGFKRDDVLQCFVNKFMVLEMTLNNAYCLLVILPVWPNIFEKKMLSNQISSSISLGNIWTEE